MTEYKGYTFPENKTSHEEHSNLAVNLTRDKDKYIQIWESSASLRKEYCDDFGAFVAYYQVRRAGAKVNPHSPYLNSDHEILKMFND